MKKLLKSKLFLLAFLVLGLITINVDVKGESIFEKGTIFHPGSQQKVETKGKHSGKDEVNTVSTPIDGSLVVLLIGGTIAFVSAKKKKVCKN
jgi:hypothetical protein